MTVVMDGKKLADEMINCVALEISNFKKQHNISPTLAIVLVGDDPASSVYVRNKIKRAGQSGLQAKAHYLPECTTQQELDDLIDQLNHDNSVHGILVQLPLPKHLSESRVIKTIFPEKDVDGFHPENIGKLVAGQQVLVPCTPMGCMMMLKRQISDLSGKHAVVIGRSNIVGKPISNLLLQEDCTVTVVHSRSKEIENICRSADILIVAVGQPLIVKDSWVKHDAVILDVGINQVVSNGKYKLVGDVDYNAVFPKVSAISPVPGGVGPMTIACLMKNTLIAAQHQLN